MHILEFNALLIPCQKEKDVELSLLRKNCTLKTGCQFSVEQMFQKNKLLLNYKMYENVKTINSMFFTSFILSVHL